MTLKPGDKAPDFTLPSDTSPAVSLKDFRGQPVILYFYPKDHTPGCTREACDFRDAFSDLANMSVTVLGISRDKPATHQKFRAKHALPFPLLSDESGDVCESYQVINKKNLFGNTFLGIQRSTFLIDKDGLIKAIWHKVKVAGHVKEILATLEK